MVKYNLSEVRRLDALINFDSAEVKATIKILLQDKSTKQNIIWATDTYSNYGLYFEDTAQITDELVSGVYSRLIQPRVYKALEAQSNRTRKHAEVFTPSWICNLMNNYCDEEWFGCKDVFNRQDGESRVTNRERIEFPEGKTWKDYVDSRRLEITCGEAPYLVSRYDTTTGDMIPTEDRIGILDRKLRVINENVTDDAEWIKWVYRAFQSVYGYEYQGDNVLIARINLLMTFVDYYTERYKKAPESQGLKKIANIIAWNIWQMDGLKGTVPLGKPREEVQQLSWFGDIGNSISDDNGDTTLFEQTVSADEGTECLIYDWRADRSIKYSDLKKGRK